MYLNNVFDSQKQRKNFSSQKGFYYGYVAKEFLNISLMIDFFINRKEHTFFFSLLCIFILESLA